MGDLMREIRDIYQSWLEGALSQEDALFAIGDVLEQQNGESAGLEGLGDVRAVNGKSGS